VIESPIVELQWTPERSEFMHAWRLSLRGVMRRPLLLIAVPAVAVAVLFLIGRQTIALLAGGLIVALVVLMVFGQPWLVWVRIPRVRLPLRATVSRDGLRVAVQDGSAVTDWAWTSFAGLVESPRVFLLVLAQTRRGGHLALPKRAAADPDDLALLGRMLRTAVAAATGAPAART
jgi:hypothetical protein